LQKGRPATWHLSRRRARWYNRSRWRRRPTPGAPCCAEALMHSSQFDVASVAAPTSSASPAATAETTELLRQILEVQREQLNQLRASAAAQDHGARWRSLLARWREDYPNLPEACRQALPTLERAYGGIIASLVEELRQNGSDALDNDFALQD